MRHLNPVHSPRVTPYVRRIIIRYARGLISISTVKYFPAPIRSDPVDTDRVGLAWNWSRLTHGYVADEDATEIRKGTLQEQ